MKVHSLHRSQKILDYRQQIKWYMQTIEISDKLYKEILAHRQGKESISRVIERNFKPKKSQLEKDIDKLDAEIRASKKTKTYTSAQVKKELGL